jgi:hypothetical protein
MDPEDASAVNVTFEFPENSAVQVAVQLTPRGELVTLPDPMPDFTKLRVAFVTPHTTGV